MGLGRVDDNGLAEPEQSTSFLTLRTATGRTINRRAEPRPRAGNQRKRRTVPAPSETTMTASGNTKPPTNRPAGTKPRTKPSARLRNASTNTRRTYRDLPPHDPPARLSRRLRSLRLSLRPPTVAPAVTRMSAGNTPDTYSAAKRHGRLSFFTKRWSVRREQKDSRPWFEASFVFQARDMAQAEFLFLAMEDGLGCGNDCEHEVCPHFRVAGLHQIGDDDA